MHAKIAKCASRSAGRCGGVSSGSRYHAFFFLLVEVSLFHTDSQHRYEATFNAIRPICYRWSALDLTSQEADPFPLRIQSHNSHRAAKHRAVRLCSVTVSRQLARLASYGWYASSKTGLAVH